MDEFKLVVGGEYVDGRGELHTCVEADAGIGVFRCDGADTGSGWYYPDGKMYGVIAPDDCRLRPIPE